MTNNDVSHGDDQQLRQILARYRGRFEPSQPQWAAIRARRPAVPRLRSRWWKITPIAIAAAAAVAAINLLSVTVAIGPPRAEARGVPGPPPYHAVVRPTFPARSTMAAIQSRGVIRVGVKDDQPGFGLRDGKTGVWSGFDVEIAKLMAAGIFGGDVGHVESRIVWVPVVSKDRETYLEAGTVDIVVATYTINEDRKAVVDFVGPYYQARQDIMVKTADTAVSEVADLNGRKVCTARGSTSYQNLLKNAPRAEVVLLDTYSACATALDGGRVEAVTTDDAILAGLVKESAFAFRLVRRPFSDEPYGIGLKKGDAPFQAFLKDRLRTIDADSDWSLAYGYALQHLENVGPPTITG